MIYFLFAVYSYYQGVKTVAKVVTHSRFRRFFGV